MSISKFCYTEGSNSLYYFASFWIGKREQNIFFWKTLAISCVMCCVKIKVDVYITHHGSNKLRGGVLLYCKKSLRLMPRISSIDALFWISQPPRVLIKLTVWLVLVYSCNIYLFPSPMVQLYYFFQFDYLLIV